ncbi:lysosomal acid phosphatase-like [Neodiprion virginianus]|uniref:lysosomal acid phosphatase-like n=1 Tax=Neodiprion virginianus TaxID=2961670 RepID=UPI001EE77F84|nr:lysosomal acid phosphatase-like [Neodiprion virginianus]
MRDSSAVFRVAIAFVLLTFHCTASTSPSHEQASLQQVVIVFRHGDRAPLNVYPNDPYADYPWPSGKGGLTKKGMLQLYTLGQRIREMYGSLIDDEYRSNEILVRSSHLDRAIMSAQSLLAGLYLPEPEDQFIPGLLWRPVTVQTIPQGADKLIVMDVPCPRFENESAHFMSELDASYNDPVLFNILSKGTGMKITSLESVLYLRDIFQCQELNGLPLPDWATNFLRNETIKANAYAYFDAHMNSLVQKRLRGGPLLKEILQNMWMSKNGTNERRMHLYAAHDYTLVYTSRLLGFNEKHIEPAYGACLIFELHTVDGGRDHRVKISFLNTTETTIPHPLNVPGCGTSCSLETLSRILNPVLPENWDNECMT